MAAALAHCCTVASVSMQTDCLFVYQDTDTCSFFTPTVSEIQVSVEEQPINEPSPLTVECNKEKKLTPSHFKAQQASDLRASEK